MAKAQQLRNFKELQAKMAPEARKRSEAKANAMTAKHVAEAIHVAVMRARQAVALTDKRAASLGFVSQATVEALSENPELPLTWQELVFVLLGAALYVQLANGIVGREETQ